MTIESRMHSAPRHSKEVFMAGHQPQIPKPQAPNIQDRGETLSNISLDPPALDGETDKQKAATERKNRARQAHCNHAQHHKEEWERY